MADSGKNSAAKAAKFGLKQPAGVVKNSSNLLTPTSRSRKKNIAGPVFTKVFSSVADSRGKYSRQVLTNQAGFPYRPARLVDFNGDPTRPWFIQFYVYDLGRGRLVRKRVGKDVLNEITRLADRRKFAQQQIAQINKKLADDGKVETAPAAPVKSFDFHGYKLLDAITYVQRHKLEVENKSPATAKQYKYTRTVLHQFLQHHKLPDRLLLRQVTPDLLQRFSHYLREVKHAKPKTHNDRISTLYTAFETLRKLDPDLWADKNPAARVQKLSVTRNTHAAYTPEQIKKMHNLITPRDPQLMLFLYFICYTLARPKELLHLKVAHLRPDVARVLLVGEHAKTDVEKYVAMPRPLAQLVQQHELMKYPPEHYVFTPAGHPGPQPVGVNYFYKRFRIYLAQLGFKRLNPRYTLYSFKHSGAIALYQATRDLALVQAQCRHTTPAQTSAYLADLGLFTDLKKIEDWQGF